MNRCVILTIGLLFPYGTLQAQEYVDPHQPFVEAGVIGQDFVGPASVGNQEPLFLYDDLERWKHGWVRAMPYYAGYHSFRPYNYHHVFSQSQTAAGWGMSPVLPYSQQFWHRYENQADLSGRAYTSAAPAEPGRFGTQNAPPGLVPLPRTAAHADHSPVAPVQYGDWPYEAANSVLPVPAQSRPAARTSPYLLNGPTLP